MDVKGQSFLIFSISDEEESGGVEQYFMLVCEDGPERNKKTKNKKFFEVKSFFKMIMLRVQKDCEGLNLKLCWVFLKFLISS